MIEQKLMILYRNSLRMSPGKIAAQAVHAAASCCVTPSQTVIVLGVTETKFKQVQHQEKCVVIRDAGYTEVDEGTVTCLAYFAPLSIKQVRKRWGRAVITASSAINPFSPA